MSGNIEKERERGKKGQNGNKKKNNPNKGILFSLSHSLIISHDTYNCICTLILTWAFLPFADVIRGSTTRRGWEAGVRRELALSGGGML